MQYLAIIQNGESNKNITFDAEDFKAAENYIKSHLRNGMMFEVIKLVELSSMDSKKYYFEKKLIKSCLRTSKGIY